MGKRFLEFKNALHKKILKIAALILIINQGFLMGVFIIKNPDFIWRVWKKNEPKNENLLKINQEGSNFISLQENSLIAIPGYLFNQDKKSFQMPAIITAYSSTTWETDDDPWITAAGTPVREGIVANNLLKFGTKIKIPEIFGDKIFIVEDRLNPQKSKNHIDIWFPSTQEALEFGVVKTYIEILPEETSSEMALSF
jgi:3D (Asp-Asp-Asp) domain-containing protein